jgi:hypothetical protein
MSIIANDSATLFNSNWDIDQLTSTGSHVLTSTAQPFYPFSGYLPIFEVQFKPTGSTVWYGIGTNATAATFATSFTCYTVGGTSNLVFAIPSNPAGITGGTIRYFVWSDKLVY